MSVTETFDDWYTKLSEEDKEIILSHVFESYTDLRPSFEGFNAGPSGKIKMILDGVNAGPSGVSRLMSQTGSSRQKCTKCGREL